MRIFLISLLCVLSLAGSALAGEPVSYKGRIIAVGDSPAASECLNMLRRGIDLVEGLPAGLRGLGGEVKALRCDPPSNPTNDPRDNVTGVYVRKGGFIDFRRNPAFLSPAKYALALVSNGVYASQPTLPADAAGPARRQLECRIMKTELETVRALKLDPRLIDSYSAEIANRKC